MKNSRVNKIVAPVFLFVLIIMSSAGATTSLVGHALAQQEQEARITLFEDFVAK